MSWLVQYRATSGDVVTAHHDTREGARDALVDQLLASALQLWAIGQTYGRAPSAGPVHPKQQSYFDRGDRFIHHAARLMGTTEGEYVIAGAGGRKWILCELQSSPHPSPATTYEGLTDEESPLGTNGSAPPSGGAWHDMPMSGMDH